MFNKHSAYNDFFNAGDGIATNILSAQLLSLEENEVTEKLDNPGQKQGFIINYQRRELN
jgi:DNA-binding HxlR family transcriptional regulator